MITELPLERSVLDEIEKLLIKKKAGTELDVGLKIKVLNQFL
ncbi:nucleotidyltransferase domain-containing protein, partial [Bacillus sp. HC-Mk]